MKRNVLQKGLPSLVLPWSIWFLMLLLTFAINIYLRSLNNDLLVETDDVNKEIARLNQMKESLGKNVQVDQTVMDKVDAYFRKTYENATYSQDILHKLLLVAQKMNITDVQLEEVEAAPPKGQGKAYAVEQFEGTQTAKPMTKFEPYMIRIHLKTDYSKVASYLSVICRLPLPIEVEDVSLLREGLGCTAEILVRFYLPVGQEAS